MKEIALIGTNCHVFAEVLGKLLSQGLSVEALVDFPEKVMIDNDRLTVLHHDVENAEATKRDLEGYATAVLTYNDNLQDAYTNDLTLKHFSRTVKAVRDAGVKRVIVVGSPDSTSFFVSDLRRLDDIDWIFISTEGDFAGKTAAEVVEPRHHKEIYNGD